MIFSRFVSCFERNDVICLYNSLRIKPVYLSKHLYAKVKTFIQNTEYVNRQDTYLQNIVSVLQDSKIIVENSEYDDSVMSRLRNQIGLPNVKLAYFILTENCNYNCEYCFIKHEMPKDYKPITMSTETARAALETYARLIDDQEDDKLIIFYGGEPLLNWEVLKYTVDKLEEFKTQNKIPKDVKISMVTNGSLITVEMAKYFKEHNIGLGISIDGMESVTDAYRKTINNDKTYEITRKGIKIAQEAGCDVSLSVTISKETIKQFDSTMDLIIKEIDVKSLGFNILMYDGNDDIVYSNQAAEYIINAFKIFRELGIYEDRIMRKVNSFTKGQSNLFDCAASGANQIVIAPDGKIGICHSYLGTRTYFVGNVYDNSFDPSKEPVFLEWNKRTPINMPECQDCCVLGICGGGCPVNAQKKYGSIWKLDDRFCIHAKKTLEWLIWDLYEHMSNSNLSGEKKI